MPPSDAHDRQKPKTTKKKVVKKNERGLLEPVIRTKPKPKPKPKSVVVRPKRPAPKKDAHDRVDIRAAAPKKDAHDRARPKAQPPSPKTDAHDRQKPTVSRHLRSVLSDASTRTEGQITRERNMRSRKVPRGETKKPELRSAPPKPEKAGIETLHIPGARSFLRDANLILYGLADMAADYGEAAGKDVVDFYRRGPRKVPGRHLAKRGAQDVLGFVGAAETMIAVDKFFPKALRKELLSVDPEKVKISLGSGEVDEQDTARAKQFFKEHPLIAALMVTPVIGAAGRRASVGAIEASMRAANPALPKHVMAQAAKRESRMPGTAAAHGIKGGIEPRVLEGSAGIAYARPWSRSPLGRKGQRAYDKASAKIEAKRGPGAKFSTSQRAATMQSRALRKQRWHSDAAIAREEAVIRKALGRRGKSKSRWEALLATIEAPSALTPRQAVEVKIRDLELTVASKTGEAALRLEEQIATLRGALEGDFLESTTFANAVKAAERETAALSDMARRHLGMTGEQLASRANRVAARYQQRGLLPRQPGTQRPRTLAEAEARIAELEAWEARAADRFRKSRDFDPRPAILSEHTEGARQRAQRMVRNKNLQRGKEGIAPSIYRTAYGGGTKAERVAAEAGKQFDAWVSENLKRYPENQTLKEARSRLDELESLKAAVQIEKERGTVFEGLTKPRADQGEVSLGTVEVPGRKIPARARGFWPHRSIHENIPGNIAPPLRSGNVIGVSQMGREFARKENRLRLYEEGLVESNPKVLSNTLRRRLSYEQKVTAREYLYEFGRDIRQGGAIATRPGERMVFVRNPAVKRGKAKSRIPDEIKREMDDPEGANLTRGAPGDAERAWMDEWLYVPGERPPPGWTRDVKNVRVVPEGVASTLMPEIFSSTQVHGTVQAAIGVLNSLARITTIYTPFLGLRYVVRNTPQNIVLLALTKPKAFGNLRQSIVTLRKLDPDLYGRIKVEVGDIPASAGLPDLPGPGRGRMVNLERRVVAGSRRVANTLGEVSDEPWRVAAWMQYAKEAGFKTPDEWRNLMLSDDPAVGRLRNDIAQRVRDDMIDFDALTPFEREAISSSFFIYPFIRGSAKWPAMYAREYPVRAAVASLISAQHMREKDPDRKPSVLEMGRTEIGGKEVDLGWLSPLAPGLGTAENVINIARAVPDSPYAASSELARSFAAPQFRELVVPSSNWERAARAFIPGYSTYKKARQSGTNIGDQALRFVGSKVDYKELTRKGRALETLREERDTVLPALKKVESKEDYSYIRRAYQIKEGIALARVAAKDKVKGAEGEPYYRARLELEANYLRDLGLYSEEDRKYLVRLARTGTYDEVKKKCDWLVQNPYERLYLRATRYARKRVGYEQSR